MKKLVSTLLATVLLLTCIPFSAVSASATAYLTYELLNDEIAVKYCDSSASGELVIPSTIMGYPVTRINASAFRYCDELTSVTIPDSVTYIGKNAFLSCYNLASITIPASVTSIGEGAFNHCGNLTSVHISDLAAWCRIKFAALYSNPLWSASLYLNGTVLTDLIIPDSVTSVGNYAFEGCISITSVTIPDSVTFIGDHAFKNCYNLKDVWYTGSAEDRNIIGTGGKFDHATWHYNTCAKQHSYSGKCDATCNNCEWTRTATPHNYADATCTVPKTCKVCGATSGSQLGHTYTNACDKTCNRSGCGHKRPVGPHKYTSELCDKDCNVCGATRKPAHLYTDSCDIDCNLCRAKRKITHTFSNNCDEYCNVCGEWREAQPHKYSHRCDRDCDECGLIRTVTHKYSNKCDNNCNYCGSKRKVAAHVYKNAVGKAATLTANGYTIKTCTNCKKTTGDKTVIRKVGHVKLSATAYTYNGSAKKPTVTVKDSMGNKISSSNYTVTYASGRKNVGTYKVTVKFKGKYTGTKTLTFKINPAKTTVKSLTAGKKSLKVAITKKTAQVSGYEVQYSTSKSFKTYKTKTLTSYKTVSTTLTGLKAKTTYYVRVRTYKTVGGVKYYSGWSTIKYKKTK